MKKTNLPYEPSNSLFVKLKNSAIKGQGRHTADRQMSKIVTTINNLIACGKEGRWGKNWDATKLTTRQIRNFALYLHDEGHSTGHIQNQLTQIRHMVRGVERDPERVVPKNVDLGAGGRSRIGQGKTTEYSALKSALRGAPSDVKAMIRLQAITGMRMSEMIMSHKSFQAMRAELERGGSKVTLYHGTKGLRIRDVYIRPERREKVLEAIKDAQAVMNKDRQFLVPSKSLNAARKWVWESYHKVGLSGTNSSHSLRRLFAVSQFKYYMREGVAQVEGYEQMNAEQKAEVEKLIQKKVLVTLSNDLGHGDGRGRWVYNNYLRATLEG